MAAIRKDKKEIDKETMYKKIMPSVSRPPKANTTTATATPPAAVVEEEAVISAQVFSEKIKAGKPVLYSAAGVHFLEKPQPLLINIMEKMVMDKLDDAFSKFNCCKCDKCKKDVAALALNKLQPKYVVEEQAKLVDHLEKQANLEVTTAIVQSILSVRAHPRH